MASPSNDLQRLHDWQVLLIDISNPQGAVTDILVINKGNSNIPSSRAGSSDDVQRLERLEREDVNVGATVRNGEALDCAEGKVDIAGGRVRQFAGNLALHDAEPALLLALFTDQGGGLACQAEVTAQGVSFDNVLQDSESHICELDGNINGCVKVVDGKSSTGKEAWARCQNWPGGCWNPGLGAPLAKGQVSHCHLQMLDGRVHTARMTRKPLRIKCLSSSAGEAISGNLFRDVFNQIIKERNLEHGVHCDHLKVDDASFADAEGWRSIGKGAMRILFDGLQLAGTQKKAVRLAGSCGQSAFSGAAITYETPKRTERI